MFLVWGSGGGSAVAANCGKRNCPTCNSEQDFYLVVSYRYAHIRYLFSWITKRTFLLTCSHCQNGLPVNPDDYRELLIQDPIPFIRRRGWLLGAGVIAILALLISFASVEGSKQRDEQAHSPLVGDIYSANLAKYTDLFHESTVYGTMKIIAIEGDTITLAIAKGGYSGKKGVRRDISSGKARANSYYDLMDTVELSRQNVEESLKSGDIFDIDR